MADQNKELFSLEDAGDIPADKIALPRDHDVGMDLKTARESAGVELRRVAQDLRIREDYLRAIENSRYADLPGIPYALGFVRSYARYLRLDPVDMVSRFKKEIADVQHGSDLVFPQPVRYRGLPITVLLLTLVLMAAVGYGAYDYFGERGALFGDRAAVPDTENVGHSATSTAPAGTATKKTAATAAKATAPAAPPAATESAKTPAPKADAPAAPKTVATAPPQPATEPKATPEAPKTAAAPESDTPKADAPKAETPAPETKTAMPENAVPKPSAPAVSPAPAAVDADKIVITAKANAWISIRTADNRVIFSRVLRPGQSYAVPGGNGLTMNIGNAGGVDVTVGGKPVKPLGPKAMPAYNVDLSPAALKNR